MHNKHWLRAALWGMAVLAFSAAAHSTEVSRFNSVLGEVVQQEDALGVSTLTFSKKGQTVALPKGWTNVSVDQVMDLQGQTGVLMSHAEGTCESRTSLLVVTPNKIRGPFKLGDCEDVMAYQKSEDGRALIGIRADKAHGKAWVYSSDDESFRGPVAIQLPDSMAALVPKEDTPPAPAPAAKARTKAAQTAPVAAAAPALAATPAPAAVAAPKAAPVVPVAPVTALAVPAKPAAPTPPSPPVAAAKPGTAPAGTLSNSDASRVVAEAKRTTAPQRAKIMINL